MTKCKDHDAEAEAAADIVSAEKAWFSKHANASTGTIMPQLQEQRIAHLFGAISPEKPIEEIMWERLAAVHSMAAIGPRNELEGMLAVQMIVAHTAAMDGMKRSVYCVNDRDWRAKEMRNATKLLQLYIRQIEALAKLRDSDKFQNYQGLDTKDIPESIRNPRARENEAPGGGTIKEDTIGKPGAASGD